MQIQFTRDVYETKKLLGGAKKNYKLTAMMLPTSVEHELMTKHAQWGRDISITVGAPTDDNPATKLMSMKQLCEGVSIESDFPRNIQEAETKIIDSIQYVLTQCYGFETFDGSTRVLDISTEQATTVARS